MDFAICLALTLAQGQSETPTAEALFAFRQATIDSIRNFEVECYCVMKTKLNGESIFGPLTYRRSGETIKYISTNARSHSESLSDGRATKFLESTVGRVPKFGMVDKPMGAHYCRDPWFFLGFVIRVHDSGDPISFQQFFLPEQIRDAKVEKIAEGVFRVIVSVKKSKSSFVFDKSIGFQLRSRSTKYVENFKLETQILFEDYSIVNGVPIAKTIREQTVFHDEKIDNLMALSKIQINSPEIDDRMTLDFPVGQPVDDYVDQVSYVVGNAGERLNVKPIQITRILPPSSIPSVTVEPTPAPEPIAAVEPIPAAEDSAYPTYAWALPLSLGLLMVAFVFRWRLRRRSGDS